MNENTNRVAGVPDWYRETFQVVQLIEGGMRNAELALRRTIEIDSLDERVRCEMQGALDALHGIKGNLALVNMTASAVLDEILSDAA